MWRAFLVGLGGLVGSLGRYWIGGMVQHWSGSELPFGTLAVNVLGSFVLGLVLTLSIERGLLNPDVRLTLAVGLCGGFTTMSTFSFETYALLQRGLLAAAAWNVATTLLFCIGAVWVGVVTARVL